MYINELKQLVERRDIRSADMANMRTILKKLQRGGELTYQEKVNLWAYFNRYGIHVLNYDRK